MKIINDAGHEVPISKWCSHSIMIGRDPVIFLSEGHRDVFFDAIEAYRPPSTEDLLKEAAEKFPIECPVGCGSYGLGKVVSSPYLSGDQIMVVISGPYGKGSTHQISINDLTRKDSVK